LYLIISLKLRKMILDKWRKQMVILPHYLSLSLGLANEWLGNYQCYSICSHESHPWIECRIEKTTISVVLKIESDYFFKQISVANSTIIIRQKEQLSWDRRSNHKAWTLFGLCVSMSMSDIDTDSYGYIELYYFLKLLSLWDVSMSVSCPVSMHMTVLHRAVIFIIYFNNNFNEKVNMCLSIVKEINVNLKHFHRTWKFN
jgi:hypothetical protein